MIPNMNSRQMQHMMRRMGVSQEDLDAVQVIIRLPNKTIYIDNPSVARVNMMGQKTFQISGEEREVADAPILTIDEADVQTVVDQVGCTADQAREAIVEHQGDLAAAILKLQDGKA